MTVSGEVKTEFEEAVEGVEVELAGNTMMKTGRDGLFAFSRVVMGGDYMVVPNLDANPLNGVSTLDLVIMQKHILGISELNSAYKVIAADINRSNSVTALDVVEARKLILGIYETFPNNTSWRFIPKEHAFANMRSPWGFPENVELRGVSEDKKMDFVGVKVGDVNESNTPHSLMGSTVRSTGVLTFEVEDRRIERGEEVRIGVSSSDFAEISGYQFTLGIGGLELIGVESGSLEMSEGNFGVLQNGVLTTSWHSVEGETSGEELFALVFRSGVSGQLSEVLRLSSEVTRAEAYKTSGEQLSVELEFAGDQAEASDYVLYQNTPNPFTSETKIGFVLPESGQARLTVMDVTGKVVKVIEGEYSRGYNEVLLTRSELRASGVLYYKLEANDYTATRKMVLVD